MSVCLRLFGAMLVLAALQQTVQARGFGGAHGGGFGGGMHGGFGGGFSGGDMRGGFGGFPGGGFPGGGIRAPGLGGAGGFGGIQAGGFRGPGFAGDRSFNPGGGLPGGFRTGGFDRSIGGYGAASRGDLNHFLSLPTDAGLHAVGGVGGLGALGAGPRGLAGAGTPGARDFRYLSPAANRAAGWDVRRGFNGYGWYSRSWYGRYPGCWQPAAWYRANLAAGAWAYCTWPFLGAWFGYGGAAPIYYNYGNNFLYSGGNVYYDGQPLGTASQYYDQLSGLAGSGAEPEADASDWLPLGVFSLVESGQKQPSLVFQLAVNKAGTIRGNCSQPDQEFVGVVNGAVDKEKQLAAWTVGDDKQTVYETGLYNLTKDEAPALVHRGPDQTEQWLLVRMKESDNPQPAGAPDANQ